MKPMIVIAVATTFFIFGAIGGWLVSRHYADQACGLALLAQIESESSQQIASYARMQEIVATGDNARLSEYLARQIEMARLAARSSTAAMEK
jgi:hypothetical protein